MSAPLLQKRRITFNFRLSYFSQDENLKDDWKIKRRDAQYWANAFVSWIRVTTKRIRCISIYSIRYFTHKYIIRQCPSEKQIQK